LCDESPHELILVVRDEEVDPVSCPFILESLQKLLEAPKAVGLGFWV